MEKLAYSVSEVAEMLSIRRTSAYTYVRTGVIQSVSLGGRIIVPRKALDDLGLLSVSWVVRRPRGGLV